MFKTLLNKTKRSFSQTASELGKVHPTVSLEEKSSKFFELVPLKGLKEALEAPEGAVAVTRPGPIQYELLDKVVVELVADIKALKNQINVHENHITFLDARVKALEIGPSIIKMVETVRVMERDLIEHFFPLLYQEMRTANRRIAHMKKFKDPKNDIEMFFENPIVCALEKVISKPAWKELEAKRNNIAHEDIENNSEILSTWNVLMREKIVSADPEIGADIAKIHREIQNFFDS